MVLDGNSALRPIVRRPLLPSFTSHLIAQLTQSIPGMVIAARRFGPASRLVPGLHRTGRYYAEATARPDQWALNDPRPCGSRQLDGSRS